MSLPGAAMPRLAAGVRLREDVVRQRWVLVGPERLFVLDETALAILRLADGTRSVDAIAATLAAAYDAPPAVIAADAGALLQELADKGMVAT